jgi:hypothetical protein
VLCSTAFEVGSGITSELMSRNAGLSPCVFPTKLPTRFHTNLVPEVNMPGFVDTVEQVVLPTVATKVPTQLPTQLPAHLVAEVNVPWRVDEVEQVVLAITVAVHQGGRLRLDGDAALTLHLAAAAAQQLPEQ